MVSSLSLWEIERQVAEAMAQEQKDSQSLRDSLNRYNDVIKEWRSLSAPKLAEALWRSLVDIVHKSYLLEDVTLISEYSGLLMGQVNQHIRLIATNPDSHIQAFKLTFLDCLAQRIQSASSDEYQLEHYYLVLQHFLQQDT